MILKYKFWQKLFLFCLGLAAGTAFCMKWVEADFSGQEPSFSVIGLEMFYSQEKMAAILSGLDKILRTELRFHLSFDFLFMAGVYPGIAALCMMARDKSGPVLLRNILLFFALAQALAWGCDLYENFCLLEWVRDPSAITGLSFYHVIVWTKWVLALSGALVAIPLALKKRMLPSAGG